MLLGRAVASIVGNVIPGKEVIRASEDAIRAEQNL